jgi:hypothetical protein
LPAAKIAEAAVEDQLIGGGGNCRRRRSNLIEKQDAFRAVTLGVRQHRRDRPFHDVADAERDATQVGRLHLRQADVDDRYAVFPGHLRHHLRFAHAGRAPQHDRRVVTLAGTLEFTFEDGEDKRRAHGISG